MQHNNIANQMIKKGCVRGHYLEIDLNKLLTFVKHLTFKNNRYEYRKSKK